MNKGAKVAHIALLTGHAPFTVVEVLQKAGLKKKSTRRMYDRVEMIKLKLDERMSAQAIASKLGCTASTVSFVLHKAKLVTGRRR